MKKNYKRRRSEMRNPKPYFELARWVWWVGLISAVLYFII